MAFHNRPPRAKKPTNCRDCDVELIKEVMVKVNGVINKRCRKCHNKYIGKINKKKYKALKEFESWFK